MFHIHHAAIIYSPSLTNPSWLTLVFTVYLVLKRSVSLTPSAASVKNTPKRNSTAMRLQGVLLKLAGGQFFTFQEYCIQGKQ
jgi:hypothetical protein